MYIIVVIVDFKGDVIRSKLYLYCYEFQALRHSNRYKNVRLVCKSTSLHVIRETVISMIKNIYFLILYKINPQIQVDENRCNVIVST